MGLENDPFLLRFYAIFSRRFAVIFKKGEVELGSPSTWMLHDCQGVKCQETEMSVDCVGLCVRSKLDKKKCCLQLPK